MAGIIVMGKVTAEILSVHEPGRPVIQTLFVYWNKR